MGFYIFISLEYADFLVANTIIVISI